MTSRGVAAQVAARGDTGARTRTTLAAAAASGTAAGSAAVAVACCASPALSPLIVAAFGASGAAWLAGFKPYTGYVLAGGLIFLIVAFRSAYRAPACPSPAAGRTRPLAWKLSMLSLGLSTAIWLGAAVVWLRLALSR